VVVEGLFSLLVVNWLPGTFPALPWNGAIKKKDDNMRDNAKRINAKVLVQIVIKCEKGPLNR
jgi:hypothetical protein